MRTVMRSPEGEDLPEGEGVFLEVVPGRKLVFTNMFGPGWVPQVLSGEGCDFPMVGIFALEPEGAGTRYMGRAYHFDEESLKKHKEVGFEQGWGQCAAQLAELAESERSEEHTSE